MRICLAASGGGHVRQLLDLKPAWGPHDVFFVSEDTALGRSIAQEHPCDFVSHVALGQGRLGKPLKMVSSALRNLFESVAIVLRRRPQVVISTGAGSVFFVVLWARLFGARIVAIDSFARFDRPSAFARLAFPLAHKTVVQSLALAPFWPKAAVFDPLRVLDRPRPAKQPLLFATVGASFPFDRLVGMVTGAKAAGLIPEQVLIQSGPEARPQPAVDGVEIIESLPFDQMQTRQREADIVVCHGGTGSLITALREGCRVIAVPRLFELGEHYDDHQAEITSAFAARGLISVANSDDELITALAEVRSRTPLVATTEPDALINHLKDLLGDWGGRR